jgi:PAS domain-containing protein
MLGCMLTQPENSRRKKAEEALREREQRLQDVVDNTAAIVLVKDLELRYILISREFQFVLPASAEDSA